MKFWALLITGAVSPFLFDTVLPLPVALLLLLLVLLLVVLAGRVVPHVLKPARLLLVVVAMFVFTSVSIHQRLSQRLPGSLDKSIHHLSGVITGLPKTYTDQVRFLFLQFLFQ